MVKTGKKKIIKVELRHYVRIWRTLFSTYTPMVLGNLMHYDTNSFWWTSDSFTHGFSL